MKHRSPGGRAASSHEDTSPGREGRHFKARDCTRHWRDFAPSTEHPNHGLAEPARSQQSGSHPSIKETQTRALQGGCRDTQMNSRSNAMQMPDGQSKIALSGIVASPYLASLETSQEGDENEMKL